jgi:hypothetical protein
MKTNHLDKGSSSINHPPTESFDPVIKDMIHRAWDMATSLLSRASHVAHTLQQQELDQQQQQQQQNQHTDHHATTTGHSSSLLLFGSNHSHVETLCRHIDYIITGRLRPLGGSGSSSSSGGGTMNSIATTTRNLNANHPRENHQAFASHPPPPPSSDDDHHHNTPPPLDLFDPLLIELQKLASHADLVVVVRS